LQLTLGVSLGGLAGLVWPSVAAADLVLLFKQGHALPGQRVEAFSGDRRGRPYSWPTVTGVWVYFVPMSHAKSPSRQTPTGPPRDPAWIPLGRLHQDHAGVGRVVFTIPGVRPGSYTLGYWCIPCAPPQGATFTQAYPGHSANDRPYTDILRVDQPKRTASTVGRTSDWRPVTTAVICGLVAVALAAVLIRRRLSIGR
jgi:hypothetical protein